MSRNGSTATNRFGLGARPGEIQTAQSDPVGWVKEQLQQPFSVDIGTNTMEALADSATYQQQRRAEREMLAEELNSSNPNNRQSRQDQQDAIQPSRLFAEQAEASLEQSVTSTESVNWRLFNFFSNHFSVTAGSTFLRLTVFSYETDAIAPHINGHFDQLLLSVIKHPAMLIYLNNERSIGPESVLGKRRSNRGLNENLAREILELHTLGVDGGYTQNDVLELAMAITGWSVDREPTTETGGFVFNENSHQPGSRTLLGKEYRAGATNADTSRRNQRQARSAVEQGEAILRDLAIHPATAEFVSRKLATHYVSDQPDEALVNRMKDTWLDTGGHLPSVMETLVDDDTAWETSVQKFKNARDFIVSAIRATGATGLPENELFRSLELLGQEPFDAGSPAGYGDVSEDWDGASALTARADWASKFSSYLRVPAIELAENALGDDLSEHTRRIVSRAESDNQARALLFMSPEFQRR